jgi:hypothetical protein
VIFALVLSPFDGIVVSDQQPWCAITQIASSIALCCRQCGSDTRLFVTCVLPDVATSLLLCYVWPCLYELGSLLAMSLLTRPIRARPSAVLCSSLAVIMYWEWTVSYDRLQARIPEFESW